MSRGYSSVIRVLHLVVGLALVLALSVVPRQASMAQTTWQWYKTDTHVHSALSADTYVDLGILSKKAKDASYNAIFVTDHNLGSNFPAHGVANNRPFEDTYLHWNKGTFGAQTSTLNALAATPVNTGTKSLHLTSSSTGSAETHTWAIRGPNFRSGEITLQFSVYPTQISAGSGAYVSVSIGGDARVTTPPAPGGGPPGYTTQAGVISPGKSTILVWQLGSARAASSDSNARVITYPLSYTLNTWNHYTINISNALLDIPAADRPIDYNALTYIKMAAASNNGTVDVYFDSFLLKAASPVSPANEFIYRNSIISTYDTSTFKMFPSVELGDGTHTNRFNFNITDPAQYVVYTEGIDGILPTQQTEYPAQLNHPGSDGGVTDQEAIDNLAYGADFMEVPRNDFSIVDWDAILNQGTQVIGSGSTDKHTGSYGSSSTSTFIYAPALEFDALIRSFFEGRAFMASGFTRAVNFNLQSGLQEPYPARYPVYVPSTLSAIDVHLGVPSGISSSYNVYWFRNGVQFAVDSVSGTSYDAVKSIPLDGASTYVRAELRLISTGEIRAMTQPIFFKDVSNLPADKRYHVNGVTTLNGRGYTKLITKGIMASSWNGTNQTLSMTLENAAGSLIDLRAFSNSGPSQIQVNGSVIAPVNSLTAFESATGSSWYYDGVGRIVYFKVKHTGTTANVALNFAPPPQTGVGVWIGATQQGSHTLAAGGAMRISYAGVNDGALKLTSATTNKIVGSEAVIYKVRGVNTSFSEMMGLPSAQLDTTYWLPWYNNVDLDTQLRIGNVSNAPATVHVFVGTSEVTSPSGITLPAGASIRVSYAGVNDGPVKIVSSQNIVAAERVIYKVRGIQTSFTEMMGLPDSQLSTTYWLPWYNNVDLDTQLRIGNVSNSPAVVRVYIGGAEVTPPTGIQLGVGASTRVSYASVNDGPVKIVSNVPVVAAERVIYKVGGIQTSFTEMMGLPDSQISTTYWLPWYNNVDFDTQLRIGNVSGNAANVHVYIGATEMGTGFNLQPGESTRLSFAGINTGPVRIVSDQAIVAAERVIYKVNTIATSFSEMMGLPNAQLDTVHWLPWYNNVDLFSELRFAIP